MALKSTIACICVVLLISCSKEQKQAVAPRDPPCAKCEADRKRGQEWAEKRLAEISDECRRRGVDFETGCNEAQQEMVQNAIANDGDLCLLDDDDEGKDPSDYVN